MARPLVVVVVLGAAVAISQPARGDAVPPEPENCPPGTVGVTDHGGPRCEKEPPKNCPPGWRGAIGGECVLAICNQDADCASDGRVCRDFSICHEPHERNWTYGRREAPEGARDRVGMLGPPMPLEHPVTDWIPVNVCGGTEKCPAPSECRPGKLCVPANAPTPQVMPRSSDGKVESKPSGCGAGCAGAPSAGASGGIALALGALALLWLRGKKRP